MADRTRTQILVEWNDEDNWHSGFFSNTEEFCDYMEYQLGILTHVGKGTHKRQPTVKADEIRVVIDEYLLGKLAAAIVHLTDVTVCLHGFPNLPPAINRAVNKLQDEIKVLKANLTIGK